MPFLIILFIIFKMHNSIKKKRTFDYIFKLFISKCTLWWPICDFRRKMKQSSNALRNQFFKEKKMHGFYQDMEMRHWIAVIFQEYFLKVQIITYHTKRKKIVSIRWKFDASYAHSKNSKISIFFPFIFLILHIMYVRIYLNIFVYFLV